jgi:AcrR family transcriptional regulator
MTTAGKKWRRRKRERVCEILVAAAEAFSQGTFNGVTMDRIAKHAGVTKGTIYLYYANKRQLFLAAQDALSSRDAVCRTDNPRNRCQSIAER